MTTQYRMRRARLARVVRLVGTAFVLTALGCAREERPALTLGIPTTVQDSGLLDALLPLFEADHPGYRLRYVAAGSGELLALGARGDVDALLSHSPAAEERFMEAAYGVSRRRVMENDFIIVGPREDPAGLRGMSDAATALDRLRQAGGSFLSRGDDSGTHRKELQLWAEIGRPPGGAGYREAGEGMAAVLRAASDLGAYALCDRATYLNLRETLDLDIVVEGDPRLYNVYHVIVVAAAREAEAAEAFARWLTSQNGQAAIAAYGAERFGSPLFYPAAEGAEVERR
jgi:tungstate transport system substrate-binding protein